MTFGRVIITNYDTRRLNAQEFYDLNERIKLNPSNFVYLHTRPSGPGGDYPIEGAIKKRGLMQALEYVALSTENIPDIDFDKDPRAGPVVLGPPVTLQVNVTKEPPIASVPYVRYGNSYYSVADTP